MRRAAKRDAVESQIVEVLRKRGWSVLQVSVKDGPDLFAAKTVYLRDHGLNVRRCVAIEVKTGKAKLKPGQADFARTWQGEYVVLRNVDEALSL
jgi:Holliday junction resolvase